MDIRGKEHKQGILAFMIELREANTKAILQETGLRALNSNNIMRGNLQHRGATQVLAEGSLTVDDCPD
jgi:hypothetical protein